MRISLFCILIIWVSTVSGQILDNRDCNAFTDEPFFSTEFIKINRIKAINGHIKTKKKLSPIQDKGLEAYYGFNEEGILTHQYKTRFKSGHKDTTLVTYAYDDSNRVVVKRLNDSYGFYSYNYTFDSTGQVSSEKYCRDENVGGSKVDFKLGKQTIIVSENFKNQWVNDSTMKKRYFNNYGRPYQEKYFHWDDKGYLIEEETRLLLNSKRNKIEYRYNEKGLVTEKIQSSNVTGNSTLKHVYSYDEVGNLTQIDEYRNGNHVTKREVVYSDNMLLEAVIVWDVATKFMTIVSYDFEFYE